MPGSTIKLPMGLPTFRNSATAGQQNVEGIQGLFGPDALADAFRSLLQTNLNTPAFNAQRMATTAGASGIENALRTTLGRSGLSRTGVGQVQGALGQSAGAFGAARDFGNLSQQTMAQVMQLLGLQAGILPSADQIFNPRRFDPVSRLQTQGRISSRLMHQQSLIDQELARLQARLERENSGGFWGNLFASLGGFLPGVGPLIESLRGSKDKK